MKWIRTSLIAVSVAFFLWAVIDGQFRDGEGFLTGRATFPIAGAVALLTLALSSLASVTRSGAWLALALMGQAAALQLIEAGSSVRYQHYAPAGVLLSGDRVVFLGVLAIQALICAIAVVKRWPAFRDWVGRAFSAWKLVCVALLFVVASAALSRSPTAYAFELILAAMIQIVALVTVVMAVLALPRPALHTFWRRASRVLGPELQMSGPSPQETDRFALVPAMIVTTAAAILSVLSYERHPHIPDEVAYILNAKYFAAGMLFMPAPPVPAAFDVDLMQLTPKQWFSSMPPGWPAILAAGVRFDLHWLVNPLLAGINVILTHLFLREIYPKRTARLALILLCVSPWYVFMGMNFMTHMFSLTAALCGAIAVSRLIRTGSLRWGWIGGAAIGILSLTRPLEGLLLAVLLALWTLTSRGLRRRLVATGFIAAASIVVGALTLPYNKALTGRMTEHPLTAYVSTHYGAGSNDLGFGPDRGWGWTGLDPFPGHDAVDAVINAALNLFAVNIELLGWATGSLLFVLVLFSRRLQPTDLRMLIALLGVSGILSLYWFSGGPDFGARYWFLMIVPLVALTARGIEVAATDHAPASDGFPVHRARSLAMAAILCAMSLVTFVPWRAIDKYHHYRGMRPDVRELAKRHSFGRDLIMIVGSRHPDFASAAAYEPPRLDADAPIYAWARTPQVAAEAIAAFPGRRVWLLEGPSVTGSGFRVAHRPEPVTDNKQRDPRAPLP